MPSHPSKRLAALLALVLAALAGAGLGIALDDDAGPRDRAAHDRDRAPVPVAVGVDGADLDTKPDDTIVLDREAREVAQNAAETPEKFDMSGDLRGEDNTPVAQRDGPLATPNWPGCTTRFLPTNWSNRVSAVRAVGLHYTAGANRPGLSDMNGLTAYASSPSAGVSWHFLIDADGNCYYSVPVAKKAWTIGNLNSQTVNIEVVGTGKEQTYPAGSPGARRLEQVVRRIGQVYQLPMQLGVVSSCNVTRPGIITHWQGGPCAGGHIDIKPYDIAAIARRIAAAGPAPAAYDLSVLLPGEGAAATCLLEERRVAKRHGGWENVHPSHLRRAERCKRQLQARNEQMHRLGANSSTANRRARHATIHAII